MVVVPHSPNITGEDRVGEWRGEQSTHPMSETKPQVLVVGAGPTGLLLAAELARRDVECLLIDALDAPQSWDRATVLHARSTGDLRGARARGPGARRRRAARAAARFHSDGDVLGVLDFAASGGTYPFDIGLSEEVTERVLTEFLESQGGTVTRSTRLVGPRAAATTR